ncbi:MAG TPA: ATP-binding protein [Oligoflexus sp.]|uniref:ATP-binding protein n=1 Tax=Oligoflexus sp. TaxID=1971216 RepID=UPI002D805261|nr:ATP-binding protein [Oligoflexus sp.]HET9236233.1 ATP-binding protein [Oligoflexus sp.]
MPCVWFIIAILFFAPQARALEAPGPMNLAEPETLNWALFDDPQGLHDWVKSSWRALAKNQESVERVRAFAFYAQLVLQWSYTWDEKEDLNKTAEAYLKLCLDRGWTEEYLHLYTLFRHPSLTKENASSAEITLYYQDTLQKIQSMGGSRHRYLQTKMRYAQHLETIGELQEGLRLAKETYEAMQTAPDVPALTKLVNLMDIADFFNKTGEFERAKTIWDIAYRELKQSRLRNLTLVQMNVLGHQYFRQHTPEGYEKAATFYEQALKAAEDLHDQTQMAYVYISLSRLAWKQKSHKAGIQFADKSLVVLEREGDSAWIGEAYLQKSRNQLELGLYEDALASVLKAQRNYDPNNLFDQRYVEQIKAEAFKGLKRFDEAFDALKLANEIDTKLTKEQSHSEVSSQLADLGLQVEQAKSKALGRENEQKETELKAARRFKIILIALLVLAVLVIGLMIFSLHEKRLLAISQKRVRAILDHIDEAIVLIKPDLTIEAEYSRYLESLFTSTSEPMKDAHAIRDIIRPFMSNTDDATVMQNSLEACFHENRTVWDLNEGHMLQESQCFISGHLRFFSFHWQPIFDSESRLIRVLLGIRDVTARKTMEAEFAEARQEKTRLFEKVQELLSVDRSQVVQLLDRMAALKQQNDLSRIRFELHGIKGLARTLSLRQLAEAVHEMESALKETKSPINWQPLDALAQGYRHILDEVLVSHESRMPTEAGLAAIVAALLPDLRQRAQALPLEWQGIELDDQISHWDSQEMNTVRELLLHATSNSLDHGYKFPRQRGEAVAPFHLRIHCREDQGLLRLHIQDKGAGINWSALADKARRLQVEHQTQADLTAVLFMEGVTTATQLTTTSGRGVGLSAMKYSLEQRGGHIEIQSQPGAGTEVICTWPRQASRATPHDAAS